MVLPLNFRTLIVVSLILTFFVGSLILRDNQTRSDYQSVTGKIKYIGKTYLELPFRNVGKMRYILLDVYEYPFEIFTGKDAGDFKPKFDQIDSLKLNDTVTIYYYESGKEAKEGINNHAKFIDKDNVCYFEKGSERAFEITMLLLGLSVGALGFVLYKKGKIPY